MTGRRGPYAKTPARRAQIIDAAFAHFAHHGYYGATLTAIAEQVGITHVGLRRHFASKEELLAAVLQRRDDLEQERLIALGPQPLGMRLPALLQHYAEAPELVRLNAILTAEAADPAHPAHEYISHRYERGTSGIALRLAGLQATGHVAATVNVRQAAAIIIAVMEGLELQWLHNPTIDMPESLEAFLRDYLGDGITAEIGQADDARPA